MHTSTLRGLLLLGLFAACLSLLTFLFSSHGELGSFNAPPMRQKLQARSMSALGRLFSGEHPVLPQLQKGNSARTVELETEMDNVSHDNEDTSAPAVAVDSALIDNGTTTTTTAAAAALPEMPDFHGDFPSEQRLSDARYAGLENWKVFSNATLGWESDEYFLKRPKLAAALKRYVAIHNGIVEGRLPPRYAVGHSWGGMNNRILPMLSTLLFAIVTDRAFLTDLGFSPWSWEVWEYAGINWELRDYPRLHQMFPSASSADRAEYHFDENGTPFPTENLACSNYSNAFTEKIIDLQANCWFAMLIMKNPLYESKIKEIFGEKKEVYPALQRWLLRPYGKFKTMLDATSERVFGTPFRYQEGQNCIAIQIRHGQLRFQIQEGGYTDAMYDRAFESTMKAVETMVDELHSNTSQQKFNDSNLSYFVATDTESVRQRIISTLGPSNVKYISNKFDELVWEQEWLNGYLDVLMMSQCNLGIVTASHSTFGYAAVSYGSAQRIFRVGRYCTDDMCSIIRVPDPQPTMHTIDIAKVSCFQPSWLTEPGINTRWD